MKAKKVNSMKKRLGLNQSLNLVSLSKSTWYYYQRKKINWKEKYAQEINNLKRVVTDNPGYGYKRATPELNEKYGYSLNKKTVLKLMRNEEIQLMQKAKKPKPNIVSQTLLRLGDKMNLVALKRAKGEKIALMEVAYTDFTQLFYCQGKRSAQLMAIIDHQSKVCLSWGVGRSANTQTALIAWKMAEDEVKKLGFTIKGMIIHHDRDPVYTGYEWLGQILIKSRAKVSYALRGAKDNPEMESFNGRFKEEGRCLFWECSTLEELKEVVQEQIIYYNTKRRHSSLGNQSPLTYIKKRQKHRRF